MNPNNSMKFSSTIHSCAEQNIATKSTTDAPLRQGLSTLLVITLATILSGCVLPHHPEEVDICDNVENDMTQCHFYPSDTPYMRSKTSERAPTNIAQQANNVVTEQLFQSNLPINLIYRRLAEPIETKRSLCTYSLSIVQMFFACGVLIYLLSF